MSASSHSASCFRGGRAGEGNRSKHDRNLFPDRDSTISTRGRFGSGSSRGVDRSVPIVRVSGAETRTRVGPGE